MLCIEAQEKDFILQSGEAVAVFQNMEILITAASTFCDTRKEE